MYSALAMSILHFNFLQDNLRRNLLFKNSALAMITKFARNVFGEIKPIINLLVVLINWILKKQNTASRSLVTPIDFMMKAR